MQTNLLMKDMHMSVVLARQQITHANKPFTEGHAYFSNCCPCTATDNTCKQTIYMKDMHISVVHAWHQITHANKPFYEVHAYFSCPCTATDNTCKQTF